MKNIPVSARANTKSPENKNRAKGDGHCRSLSASFKKRLIGNQAQRLLFSLETAKRFVRRKSFVFGNAGRPYAGGAAAPKEGFCLPMLSDFPLTLLRPERHCCRYAFQRLSSACIYPVKESLCGNPEAEGQPAESCSGVVSGSDSDRSLSVFFPASRSST